MKNEIAAVFSLVMGLCWVTMTAAQTTPPLHGAWFQLWNTSACQCGLWTQERWQAEMVLMKSVCHDTVYVQYSVWQSGSYAVSWYDSDGLTTNESYPALDNIFAAAESEQMNVVIGLYFDSSWNNANKADAIYYDDLLVQQELVISELAARYGDNPAFTGWYIPQEINDLEWQGVTEQQLLADYVQSVATAAKSAHDVPVIIAPYFGPNMTAVAHEAWWDTFLETATAVDVILVQDGIGTTRTTPADVTVHFSAIKRATDAHGRQFGATIESFRQTHGWPIDSQSFAAEPTDYATLQSQLTNAAVHTDHLVQFEWSYMQPSLGEQPNTLFEAVQADATCNAPMNPLAVTTTSHEVMKTRIDLFISISSVLIITILTFKCVGVTHFNSKCARCYLIRLHLLSSPVFRLQFNPSVEASEI